MSYLHFDGTSYIQTADSVPPGGGPIDVLFLARPTVMPSGSLTDVASNAATPGVGYDIRFQKVDGTLRGNMTYPDGNTWHSLIGDMALGVNEWVRLRGTYDGEVVRLFVNEIFDKSVTLDTGVASTEPLSIGGYLGSGSLQYAFVGDVAEVTIADEPGGDPLLVFSAGDPNVPDLLPDGTTWTDVHGRTWTVYGDGVTLVKTQAVEQTMRHRRRGDVFLGKPSMRMKRNRKGRGV